MIQLLILGLALLGGFFLLGRWFVSADPKAIAGLLKIGAIVLLAVVAIILLVTGRFGVALGALAFLFPLLLRARTLYRQVKSSFGPSGGQTSGLRTAFLDMNLDHDTGDLDGRVLKGSFAGRMLSDLNRGQLFDLMREMAGEDRDGLPVLEAYLDRLLGPEWRDDLSAEQEGQGPGADTAANAMTESQALEILGLERGASEDEIKAAHRSKMMTHHPDHGGTAEEAMRINQAKDLLLGLRP